MHETALAGRQHGSLEPETLFEVLCGGEELTNTLNENRHIIERDYQQRINPLLK